MATKKRTVKKPIPTDWSGEPIVKPGKPYRILEIMALPRGDATKPDGDLDVLSEIVRFREGMQSGTYAPVCAWDDIDDEPDMPVLAEWLRRYGLDPKEVFLGHWSW